MTKTSQDVISILETDHREVEEMFTALESSTDPKERKTLAEKVVIELVRHSVAEEAYVYPVIRDRLSKEQGEHAVEEHADAERTMKKLEKLGPDDADFEPTLSELMAEVRHHVKEEEGELFPALRSVLSQEELVELGGKVETMKKAAPTRPHPAAPDHPPFDKLAAPGAGFVDKLRDALTGRGSD